MKAVTEKRAGLKSVFESYLQCSVSVSNPDWLSKPMDAPRLAPCNNPFGISVVNYKNHAVMTLGSISLRLGMSLINR